MPDHDAPTEENPYEGHPSLSPLQVQILGEYASLNRRLKSVRVFVQNGSLFDLWAPDEVYGTLLTCPILCFPPPATSGQLVLLNILGRAVSNILPLHPWIVYVAWRTSFAKPVVGSSLPILISDISTALNLLWMNVDWNVNIPYCVLCRRLFRRLLAGTFWPYGSPRSVRRSPHSRQK